MDIRIVKTKRAIRSAFLELRRQTPLEKIKVVDLCTIAEINKTTFYKYYEDVLALNNALEEEVFATFLKDFQHSHALFTDTESFVAGLPAAFDKQGDLLATLYHDRYEAFYNRLEQKMKDYYIANHPEQLSAIRVAFIVSGTVFLFKEMKRAKYTGANLETFNSEIVSIIRSLM